VRNPEGRLEAINTSRGGVPKRPVLEAQITGEGIVGDVQRDLRHHGGPQRAVSIYSLDLIADDGNFTRISQKVRPGWIYCRVIVPGTIRPGELVRIL
jgi:MOSC domain-containing protein YiiM